MHSNNGAKKSSADCKQRTKPEAAKGKRRRKRKLECSPQLKVVAKETKAYK